MFAFIKLSSFCIRNSFKHRVIRTSYLKTCCASNLPIKKANELIRADSFKSWDNQSKEKIKARYGFSNQADLKVILEKYKRLKMNLSLNENIVFLNSISEIIILKENVFNITYSPVIDSLLMNIKLKLKKSEEEFPLIGTLIHTLSRLKLYKDTEIWLFLSDYTIDNRLNGSLEELIEAFKGCADIPKVTDKTTFNTTLSSLEDLFIKNYLLSMISLKDLVEVCDCYSHSNNLNYNFLEILHNNFSKHLIDKLSAPNTNITEESQNIIKIAYYFAHWSFINTGTYMHLQDIVINILGKEFNSNKLGSFNPETFAFLIYSLGVATITGKISIKKEIIDFAKRYIFKEDINFSLRQLSYLHTYLPEIGLDKKEYSLLKEKTIFIETYLENLDDIQMYLTVIADKEFNQDFTKIPKKNFSYLDNICVENLSTLKPQKVYQFLIFIVSNKIKGDFEELWMKLPEYIVQNINSFDFEQMCYLYYIYVVNEGLIKGGKFKQNLDILKDYILLHYRSIPRGKLDINSNFYKVLEVVDINQFYMPGEY